MKMWCSTRLDDIFFLKSESDKIEWIKFHIMKIEILLLHIGTNAFAFYQWNRYFDDFCTISAKGDSLSRFDQRTKKRQSWGGGRVVIFGLSQNVGNIYTFGIFRWFGVRRLALVMMWFYLQQTLQLYRIENYPQIRRKESWKRIFFNHVQMLNQFCGNALWVCRFCRSR